MAEIGNIDCLLFLSYFELFNCLLALLDGDWEKFSLFAIYNIETVTAESVTIG